MIPINKGAWLYKPWRLMSYNEYYRHYQYFDKKYSIEQNLLIVRTSDKCFKVTNWRLDLNFKGASKLELQSFRSFTEVRQYARTII